MYRDSEKGVGTNRNRYLFKYLWIYMNIYGYIWIFIDIYRYLVGYIFF